MLGFRNLPLLRSRLTLLAGLTTASQTTSNLHAGSRPVRMIAPGGVPIRELERA